MADRRLGTARVAAGFAVLGLAALPMADLSVTVPQSGAALGRMLTGFLHPDFGAVEDITAALASTVAFALAGVALGAVAGLLLAPFWHLRGVRALSVLLRSVHELFWALVLLQIFGISPVTGVLAIGLPYAGTFAKVFAEQIEEADPRPAAVLPPRTGAFSRFLWARLPLVTGQMQSYLLYRVECGLRSSAVLGFIGLPTLGFQLDTFFRQGDYGPAGAIMAIYILLIATLRGWLRLWAAPVLIALAALWLAMLPHPPMGAGALWRFISHDIVPSPLRSGAGAGGLGTWLAELLRSELLPGSLATLIVGQIALVLTGLLAFAGFGMIVPRVAGWARGAGYLALVVLRSFPEYMLAYLLLQLTGPSMLPAVLALALHNGAIVAHLLGREAAMLPLRPDAPRGAVLWAWELAPRMGGRFVALCLYRWEIILRETAVMGILGVPTLGFYIDSAMSELRVDRALILLAGSAAITAGADSASRAIRRRMAVASALGISGPSART